MRERFRKLLEHRRLPLVLAALAILCTLPSLWTGWQQDDIVQRYFLLGNPDPVGRVLHPLDQFRLLDGDTSYALGLMNSGAIPWWALPTVRLSFWRPLSVATQWIDYLFWPQSAILMHVQSLLWLGTLIFLAALLYRRFIGSSWGAGLAALFFALDDVHGLPAGWLANRNSLIAGAFGILVLLAHDRWRRDGWKPGSALGPLFLALALLAGESGLASCAYLFAYALFLDGGTGRARILSLIPSAAVTLVWLVLYTRLGYGTWGSGFYVDPFSEPLQFLLAVAWKEPLLLVDQLAIPPTSIILFAQELIPALLVWAVALLILIGFLFLPLLRNSPRARFWLTGMVLSIPLVCSTVPHSRLLVFAGIGGFGLVAEWMGGIVDRADWVPAGRRWAVAARGMLYAFFAIHLVIAPVILAGNSTSAAFAQKYIQDASAGVFAGPELSKQDLVIVNHPIVFYAHYFKSARLFAGKSVPRRLRVLAPGITAVHVERPDEKTLVIRPDGGFLAFPFDNVFRGSSHPLKLREKVILTGMTVEITALTSDGRPAEASFRFSVPLEDSSLRWIRWEGEGYVPYNLPSVGESMVLPPAPPLF